MTEPVLQVSGLRAYYRTRALGVTRGGRGVDGVDCVVQADEIYGLAGESSCGKTTLIKTIAGAIRPPLTVLGGAVVFEFAGEQLSLYASAEPDLDRIRWKHLSYIMQGSMNVLNPVQRVRRAFLDFAYRHIGG